MKLTFFGGVSEIGGNKILLRDQDTTMFIDFGRFLSKERNYYQPSVPRSPESQSTCSPSGYYRT